MQKRKFDELISHFNCKVSDMSIDQKYKMELLGMISAIGFAHEKELSTNLAEVGTDCISRQAAIDALKKAYWDKNIQSAKDDPCIVDAMTDWAIRQIKALPSTQPEKRTEERTETHSCDLIDREAAVDAIYHHLPSVSRTRARTMLHEVPSAQLGQRYTNEELEIFQHGISLSLLSKRSAQHWRYDENTATEIKFLERLYEKVSANMRGGQNE